MSPYRISESLTTKAYVDLISLISFTVLTLSLIGPQEVNGKLTLSKQCGDIVCKAHYYCARIDDSCRPCQLTCDSTLHNYDERVCETDCQDYLHDLFYMRKSLHNETDLEDDKLGLFYSDIQEELKTLKFLVIAAVVISSAVLLALFALFIYIKRSRNRSGFSWCGGKRDDIMDLPVIYTNSKCVTLPYKNTSVEALSQKNNVSRIPTPDLVTRSEKSAAAVSILAVNKLAYTHANSKYASEPVIRKPERIRREPSESTLPEYLGYDNPALSPSPTHL